MDGRESKQTTGQKDPGVEDERPQLTNSCSSLTVAGPSGSDAGCAPVTEEIARLQLILQDALRQGANSNPPVTGEADLGLLECGGHDLLNMEQRDWEPLPKRLVNDSGAGETVIPKRWLPAHPIQQSPGQGRD